MADLCIIVVGFDRPWSLDRLIQSLLDADYCGEEVDLLVSIDGGPRSEQTLGAIGAFDWPHGESVIRRMPENLGLRCHILHCADTVDDYEAVIVLEDDVVVGPGFYTYARWACASFAGDERIAGISLYAPAFNEMANLPFHPAMSRYSAYALQSAQSWGQCWTRSMWNDFTEWSQRHGEHLRNASDMPDRIYSWPDSSWKKYAMKYLAETGKTWIYPYVSHSTNCSEIGTHNRQETSLFQVPLGAGGAELAAAPLEQLVRYDIYFERINASLEALSDHIGEQPITFDLYGTRQSIAGPAWLLTIRKLPRSPAATIGLSFKPHEVNAELFAPGEAASLYRIEAGETVNLASCETRRPAVFHASVEWRDSLRAGLQGFLAALARRIRKL